MHKRNVIGVVDRRVNAVATPASRSLPTSRALPCMENRPCQPAIVRSGCSCQLETSTGQSADRHCCTPTSPPFPCARTVVLPPFPCGSMPSCALAAAVANTAPNVGCRARGPSALAVPPPPLCALRPAGCQVWQRQPGRQLYRGASCAMQPAASRVAAAASGDGARWARHACLLTGQQEAQAGAVFPRR